MQAPLQSRDDSDAVQTKTASTATQERMLVDDRPAAVAQRKLADMMNNSPHVLQQRALGAAIQNSPQLVAQRHKINALFSGTVQRHEDDSIPAQLSPVQRDEKSNNGGLPYKLMSGIESLSDMSMDHVKVHYNSDKPAQMQAHAYAQGSEIHVGPGQERHLPHEAWHIVQQAQGRVLPTLQMKAGAVNDDPSLEKEADMMGEKAAHFEGGHGTRNLVAEERVEGVVTQRVAGFVQPATTATLHSTPQAVVQRVVGLEADQAVRFYDMQSRRVKQGMIQKAHAEHYEVVEQQRTVEGAATVKGFESKELNKRFVFPMETTTRDILRQLQVPVPDNIIGGWLGDAYLDLATRKRPERINDAETGYSENCLLVTAGALVGKTATDVAKDLGYTEPHINPAHQDAMMFAGPAKHSEYEHSNIGMTLKPGVIEEKMRAEHGTKEEYVARKMKAKGSLEETDLREFGKEYVRLLINEKISARPDNSLVLPNAVKYVQAQLNNEMNIRTVGGPREMLSVAKGVESMKLSPPGTRYLVYLEAPVRGDCHYLYADNFMGLARFIDYQHLRAGSADRPPAPGNHPTRVDAPTQTPTITERSRHAPDPLDFSEMCFIAFEPQHAHVLDTIYSHR